MTHASCRDLFTSRRHRGVTRLADRTSAPVREISDRHRTGSVGGSGPRQRPATPKDMVKSLEKMKESGEPGRNRAQHRARRAEVLCLMSFVAKPAVARRRRAKAGEPGRNRTFNQQIKSLLLCQLSYGPTLRRATRDELRTANFKLRTAASNVDSNFEARRRCAAADEPASRSSRSIKSERKLARPARLRDTSLRRPQTLPRHPP